MALAVVRDLREARVPASADEIAGFETDVLAGFVLARAAAGLADGTIAGDVLRLEQIRTWLGRPLWEMQPPARMPTSAGCSAMRPRAPSSRAPRR